LPPTRRPAVTAVETTAANVADVNVANESLSGDEDIVGGDSGYLNAENHEKAVAPQKYQVGNVRLRSLKSLIPSGKS
jgi:IS5 family transposase